MINRESKCYGPELQIVINPDLIVLVYLEKLTHRGM